MSHTAKAKFALVLFWIPVLLALSPLMLLLGGVVYFYETFTLAVSEEIRWAKYCDDYEARQSAKDFSSESRKP